MQRYIARRLLQLVLVLLLMSLLIFAALRLIPGDPAATLMGRQGGTEEGLRAVRHELGLDRPVYIQYLVWMREVLQGHFGTSWFTHRSTIDLLKVKLPATLMLTLAALIVGTLITLPLGILSGTKPHSVIDNAATTFSLFGVAMPPFWVGMMLMLLFAVQLRILPAGGFVQPSQDLWQSLRYLALPAVTLGIQLAASQTRFLRSGMLDVMSSEYIRTARAKGFKERYIIMRHALKNALLTVVTVFALDFGSLLGGAMVTETVFSFPGIGTLLIQAIGNRDYGVVQGVVLYIAVIYTLVNLLADISYAFLDPRIRYD